MKLPIDLVIQSSGLDSKTQHAKGPADHHQSDPIHRSSLDSSRWSISHPPVSPPLSGCQSSSSPASLISDSNTSINDGVSDSKADLSDIRLNLICNWIYQKQAQNLWLDGGNQEGVMVRKTKDDYICYPPHLCNHSDGLYIAIKQLYVKCAMTVNTRTTKLMLELYDGSNILLTKVLKLQVVSEFSLLSKCQKHQFAAFVRNPPVLVVWDDDPSHIIERVQELENQMMGLIWKGQYQSDKDPAQLSPVFQQVSQSLDICDLGISKSTQRKTVLIQPFIVAATLMIMCITLGLGWRNVAVEVRVQGTWLCLIFPVLGPLQAWLGLFFMQNLPTCIAQMIGPVRQLQQNSKFYSGKASPRLSGPTLPHVTVQCPVYKENLVTVIEPTIKSVKAAISTYEMQGGSANIFINDDGMQVISHDEAQERQEFYEEHNIGWVARPKHNSRTSDGEKVFLRAGKFKKASNMNYGLQVSTRIEDKLQNKHRPHEWSMEQERLAYSDALAEVIEEDSGKTWAAGNVRVGDYILLIDSDTRVPLDCLLDAVSEMEQCPEIAIVQFSSGVMNVTESWFENGITFFTNLVYTAIEFAVANGDVAPFVGHNAFLRWSAVQDVALLTPNQPMAQKFWSEETVSEDFDMALRLQTSGYSIRLAAYADGGFKEGVSLTVYEELARWEKYAYGCSELIFHPFAQWFTRGPFTPLFRRFIFSNMPFHSKISIMAYVGTYFAIGSSWLLTVLNYSLVGWFNGYLDHYYIDSFKIYFSIIVVFNFIGNIALAILRYRTDKKKLIPSLFENFKWVLLLTTFLGGISLHVSQAILCHLFSINMTWGATSKEATDTSFFQEIPVILRKFRFTFIFCFILVITIVVLSGVGPLQNLVPYYWQISTFTAVFPMAMMVASHALLPLALNPGLMQFTF